MIRKIIAAALLLSLTASAAAAQQRKTSRTTRVVVRHDDDDEKDRVVTSNRHVMNPRQFYRTPYSRRNNGTYSRNSRLLSVGFGFPNTLYNDFGYINNAYSVSKGSLGPLMVKYEMAIRDEVGIGAVVEGAYRQWKYSYGNNEYRDNAFGFGVSLLGYYHFNKLIPVRKLDVYAGVGLNISHAAYRDDYFSETDTYLDVLPAFVAGARYKFRPNFGAYLELGRTNFSWVNLGVTFGL
jgi:hypothetical protein